MRYETDRTRLDDGSIDCQALVRECFGRIDERRGLNAFTFVDREGAVSAAKRVDERRSSGDFRAFDGLILAVKDTISVTGLPLSCASRILGGFTAEIDATVVGRLRDLGAIIVGKTNCDEFGMGSSSEYSAHGPVRHPLDRALSAGGSSGGSAAAVAAGLCHAALGSDTGGSVRQPAAFCSVAGLRPSWGRVSRFGLTAFASSMDTIGFIAPDVMLAGRLAAAAEGEDGRDAVCRAQVVPHRIRSGVQAVGVTRGGSTYHPAPMIRAALDRAVERLAGEGLIVRDEELPGLSEG
ncbi:MAG: Asp-tRNA(Asn)/Glu-tRNA(Gln) amidotransferase subunit GatA, partial [Rhodothermales bacterium]|nr:Asp-tRNA(Asn)/Glu-tRNA(Gln) amidotransferase subunit GatA [Rhodothermales bacterium]